MHLHPVFHGNRCFADLGDDIVCYTQQVKNRSVIGQGSRKLVYLHRFPLS